MPGENHIALVEAARLSGCHSQLLFHQVEAGDHLGHRVLHLETGVHFQVVELAVLVEKLHRPGVGIPTTLGHRHGRFAHCGPYRLGQVGCGGVLIEFLMAALYRTVPIAQVDDIAVCVG